MLTIQLRYKEPAGKVSKLIEHTLSEPVKLSQTSDDFRFSAAVASFGMLLRESKYKGESTYESVQALAQQAVGTDKEGYRAQFIELVEAASHIKEQ